MSDLEYLRDFAETQRQHQYLDAIKEVGASHPSQAAAELLGIGHRNLQDGISRLKKKAALRGISNDSVLTEPINEVFAVKGTSTLYDEAGNVKIQWVKTDLAKEQQMQAITDVLSEYVDQLPIIPRLPIRQKSYPENELLTLYTLTDYHLGLHSWSEETGADWDMEIAEQVMLNAFTDMMVGSPDSEVAILNFQGDTLHWDGLDAVTPASGHILDADTRFQKLVKLALDVIVKVIGILAQKHKIVKVLCAEGNHDLASSVWLRMALAKMYENIDNVEVNTNAFPYYAYTHGSIFLGFHHGHKKKE